MLSQIVRIVVYSSLVVTAAATLIALWKGVKPELLAAYMAPFISVGAPLVSAYLAVRNSGSGDSTKTVPQPEEPKKPDAAS